MEAKKVITPGIENEVDKPNKIDNQIKLFHGSPNNFEEFEFSKIGQNHTANGFGFYFASSKELASNYSQNGFLYEVSLSPSKEINYSNVSLNKNILVDVLDDLSTEQQEDLFYNWDEDLIAGKDKCINALLEISNSDVELIGDLVNQTNDVESVLNAFASKGYTHYIKEYETEKEYVVIAKDSLSINHVINLQEDQKIDQINNHNLDPIIKMDLKEYLAIRGLESPISDFMNDKTRGNRQLKTTNGTKRFEKEATAARNEYYDKRQTAINEYKELVDEGKIVPKKSIDRELETAHGHEDHESTHASRRMLKKRGIDWQTGKPIINKPNDNEVIQSSEDNIEQDLTELTNELETSIHIKVSL